MSSQSAIHRLSEGLKPTPRDPCVICLEEISEPSRALPCRHPYDYVCLLNWLQLRPHCPLCNAPVHQIEAYDEETKESILHKVEQPRRKPTAPQRSEDPVTLRGRGAYTGRRRHRHRSPEPITPDIAIFRRRHVYRMQMRSLHVGSNRISRFQNFTPRMFRGDEELQSRARMFIRRELQVFEWTNDSAEFILEYLIAVLRTIDLKASTGAAEDLLSDFLGRENAKIFCHEIHAFLRSPFTNLAAFDNFAQYERPLPTRFDGEGMPIEEAGSIRRRMDERHDTRVPESSRRRGR